MNNINVKMLSDTALAYLEKNIEQITKQIQENNTNEWIFSTFPQPMFVTKKFIISDFSIAENLNSNDKSLDFENSKNIYENLKNLPRYILTDERFWLWLHFEKFYKEVKAMMPINGKSTVTDHWMHKQGVRRGLMFGVLSRCFYRVSLSIDEESLDKYHLTKWVIENPERFRNLTWRAFSSEEHLVRGILKGEKMAVEEKPENEKNDIYPEIAKYVSIIGSVRLLDAISENDIANMIYEKTKELLG